MTLLDFPTLERFEEEIRTVPYDVVGISGILPNVGKVKLMCELVRRHQPRATIVVGGHVANRPGLRDVVDADHVVAGEGVSWFRAFLGEDEAAPIRHPLIVSALGARTMGVPFGQGEGETAATVIPSVGCPLGCNFCSTSAMFGGKGRSFSFYEGGDELFAVMRDLGERLKTRSFFVMDENFLLHRKRALRLLELMREHGKAWALYVFSSANALRQYTDDELVGLGVSWVWLGLEGEESAYAKLKGTDSLALVRRLQGLGIRVLGSSIVGLAEHGADNIDRAIDHAVAHDTEFHQFMLYTPVAGTPLYAEHRANGTLLSPAECPDADTHGQLRFNYRHPRIRNGEETEYLLRAFRRDFEVNGPSVTRIARTLLRGWLALKDHPDPRVRARIALRDEGPEDAVRGGAVGVREVVRAGEPRARRPASGDPRTPSSGSSAGRRASPRGSSARWCSRRSGSRIAACAAAGRTSRRPSTRRTRPRPRGPSSPPGAPPLAAGSSRPRARRRRTKPSRNSARIVREELLPAERMIRPGPA